jgi:hypothetical protein
MTDENQIQVPRSFIALFVPPGKIKPTESRAFIGERYDFCEDLACLMTEHARATLFELGIAESDVLVQCHRGLLSDDSVVAPVEAGWVVRRLAELLDWECPESIGAAPQP